MTKRIVPDQCLAAIIDVQEFFLDQVDKDLRHKLVANTANFARLAGYFKIPIVVTLERPVEHKGATPDAIDQHLQDIADVFEKDFFDLTKEKKIRDHLGHLRRKQAIIAGCETDVCILQSCLGLIDLGYEVYVVEDLLFSSAWNVAAAITRMQAEGAVFLTYKSLFYELIAAVDGGRYAKKLLETYGPFPDDLPDCIV